MRPCSLVIQMNKQERAQTSLNIHFITLLLINRLFTLANILWIPPDHLLLNRSPNIGPLISRWELNKFKNC